jgi:hypothetical protein
MAFFRALPAYAVVFARRGTQLRPAIPRRNRFAPVWSARYPGSRRNRAQTWANNARLGLA